MTPMPQDNVPSLHVTDTAPIAAIAPTFNNARTLRAVLDGLTNEGFSLVIVVDDGSTDDTAAALDAWAYGDVARRVLIRHPQNRGKAAAMFTGFAAARERGFTHAITIDTDGQHDPADAGRLRERAIASPEAIVLGCRPFDRRSPLCSRIGRSFSNAMVRVIGGVAVSDSQCGLRVYPLAALHDLKAKAGRYAFETEVLIRAGWANVPIIEEPVRCIYEVPDGRVTHFRLLRDSAAAVAMHVRLLTRSCAPWPAKLQLPIVGDEHAPGTIFDRGRRWLSPLRAWRQIRRDARERDRLGASIGWGLFVGTQPPLGYKGALCLLLAKVFRLQPLVVLATSSLSTPPLGFILWGSAIVVGHLLLHGTWPTANRYDMVHLGPSVVLRNLALEWVVGGLVFGASLGLTAWLATTAIVRGAAQLNRSSSPPSDVSIIES